MAHEDSNRRMAIERYRSLVIVPADSEACWGWSGRLVAKGYPVVTVGKSFQIYAHRLSYQINVGPIPNGQFVCHHCDNPPCTNPAHLFLGTALDNARDRDSKDRGAHRKGESSPFGATRGGVPLPRRGSDNSKAKLSEAQATEIIARYRAGGVTQRALATEYGIHQSIVSEIVNGKRWAHVQDGAEGHRG